MVDNKTVVIMLVFLARKNLSLYELTVQTKFSIKVIIEQINYLNSFLAKKSPTSYCSLCWTLSVIRR